MEILIVGAIIIFILIYNNTIDKDKFFADNQKYLEALKEDDYHSLYMQDMVKMLMWISYILKE